MLLLVAMLAEADTMAEPRIQDGDNTFHGLDERGWLVEKWTAHPDADGVFVIDFWTPNVFNALQLANRWRAAGAWARVLREPPEPILEFLTKNGLWLGIGLHGVFLI